MDDDIKDLLKEQVEALRLALLELPKGEPETEAAATAFLKLSNTLGLLMHDHEDEDDE